MAKIKLPKKPHSVVIFLIKVRKFYHILTRFDIKFLKNAWDFITGSPGEINYTERF